MFLQNVEWISIAITGADQPLSETIVKEQLNVIALKMDYLKKSRNYKKNMVESFSKSKTRIQR